MKITKFPQSCVLVETQNKRILVDPGTLLFDKELAEKHWKDVDVILVTHKHADHCNSEAIIKIMETKRAKLFSTKEVAEFYPELAVTKVKEGDMLSEGNVGIEVVRAVHGYIPLLKGAKEVHENVGFILDDGKTRVYVTSDTVSFRNDYRCDVLCVPVNNHGLVMGPFEAALFAKETAARLVIPVHCDNPRFPADLEAVKNEFEKEGVKYKLLANGESTEI